MKGKEWLNSFQDSQGMTSIDWEAVDDLKQLVQEKDNYSWTLCKDKLPEERGYYLVAMKWRYNPSNPELFNYYDLCYFRGKKWAKESVVAWMPIPELNKMRGKI